MKCNFVLQIDTIREQARVHMDQGPITSAYGADRERVVKASTRSWPLRSSASSVTCATTTWLTESRGRRSRPSSSRTPTRREATPTGQRAESCNWGANPTSGYGGPGQAQPHRVRRGPVPDGHDGRGLGGGADRNCQLPGDRSLAGRSRPHHPQGDGRGCWRMKRNTPMSCAL